MSQFLGQFTDRQILEEVYRRKTQPLDLLDGLFDEQKIFHRDPARLKAALNTRRSGKTYLAATRLLIACETPSSVNPYIALTRDSAKRILWPTLCELVRKYNIKATPKEASLTVEFPNGSQVFLVGADQRNFIERLRGIKAKLAVIDEGQSYREHLKELVDDVLTPALADLNGQLDVYGTPGLRPSGYFYDVTTKNIGFKVHSWSVLNNPFMPSAAAFIEELKTRNQWTDENPTYRREWLGEWVLDSDNLLWKFNRHRNLISEIPNVPLVRVMGIDFGFHDKTAFSVVSWSPKSPIAYIEHCEAHPEMIPSEIAARCQDLMKEYSPVSIVTDTGGLGKSISEEMRRRYQIPVKAADKHEKLAAISLMNGDFIDGKLFVIKNTSNEELVWQYENTPRGPNGIEDNASPHDCADSTLYAWREAKQYGFEPERPKISRDSEEFILEALEKEYEGRQNGEWWENL